MPNNNLKKVYIFDYIRFLFYVEFNKNKTSRQRQFSSSMYEHGVDGRKVESLPRALAFGEEIIHRDEYIA